MAVFTGSGVAIVTPFKEDLTINYKALQALIDYQIEEQTDAIIVAGTTGEASTLSTEEHKDLIKFTVEVTRSRVPVIAGTGSNDTHQAISLSQHAQALGVDALLCVTPYYNRPSQEGLYQHFKAIAESVNLPIILYNVPSRTGSFLEEETIERLACIPNIVGLKDASGDLAHALRLIRRVGPDFDLYCGNDNITLPLLAIGARGTISVVANLQPRASHDLIHFYQTGCLDKALTLQHQLNQINDALALDTNPVAIKTALNYKGYEVGPLRLPLCPMNQEKEALLRDMLDDFYGGFNHA